MHLPPRATVFRLCQLNRMRHFFMLSHCLQKGRMLWRPPNTHQRPSKTGLVTEHLCFSVSSARLNYGGWHVNYCLLFPSQNFPLRFLVVHLLQWDKKQKSDIIKQDKLVLPPEAPWGDVITMPGNFVQMQILRPHPTPPESGPRGRGQAAGCTSLRSAGAGCWKLFKSYSRS